MLYKDWADFKVEVVNRGLLPQWYICTRGVPSPDEYRIYSEDSFFMFECYVKKDGGADCIDFEDNFKDIWNKKLDHRDATGIITIHSSPRPDGMTTYFSGAGDSGGIGLGNRMIFNLTASDASKSVDLNYSEDVYLKDGVINYKDAPLGSCLSVEIIHPINGIVKKYATKLPLLGTGRTDINSEDSGKIDFGLKVRVTVYNSDGTGDQDVASAFKVCGLLEMYRVNAI